MQESKTTDDEEARLMAALDKRAHECLDHIRPVIAAKFPNAYAQKLVWLSVSELAAKISREINA